jgi:hypothetical protein
MLPAFRDARATRVFENGGRMEHAMLEQNVAGEDPRNPPGIVILDRWEEKRPAITAFIWGGKVRPVPELPYGKH